MATDRCNTAGSAARRLSDLLREQQEPFLLLHHLLLHDDDDDDDSATPARTPAAARRTSLLRGSTAAATVTKLALRWADGLLTGCFSSSSSCAAARQTRFRRLPRAADGGGVVAPADRRHDGASGSGECCVRQQQQLSPVSVLDLYSDDEPSPVASHRKSRLCNTAFSWRHLRPYPPPLQPASHPHCFFLDDNAGDEHSDDDGNSKPSTSGTGTSPPSFHDHDHDIPGKIPATEERFHRKSVDASAWDREWESVAADISRIPRLVELDLSASPRDHWRHLAVVGEEDETRQVVRSIESMIFEEVRWEAVRDMLCSPQH